MGENDSINFHTTTPHTMQVTMTLSAAIAIRDAINNALEMPEGDKVLLVIDMLEDFQITTQEGQ